MSNAKLTLKMARRVEIELAKEIEKASNDSSRFARRSSSHHFKSMDSAAEVGTALNDRRFDRAYELLMLRRTIRRSIDLANRECGVSDLIEKIGFLKEKIKIIGYQVESVVEPTEHYDGTRYVSVYLPGYSMERVEELERERRKLGLKIDKLKDQANGANNNNYIELEPEQVQVLEELGLA